jgi:hypothetical protein
MKRSCIGLATGALVTVAVLLSSSNCGFERKLVGITIHPPATTFPTPDSTVQVVFSALGTYIHPPDTHDITSQVTWKTDIPQLLQINGGVVSPQPGNVCGIANISASMSDKGNLVIGFATVTVNDPTRPICPGGSPTEAVVTVTLAGPSAAGAVKSVPAGIDCPAGACGAQFTIGDTIVLTATPNTGHAFVSWTGGCTSIAGTTCSILVPNGSTNATATFN